MQRREKLEECSSFPGPLASKKQRQNPSPHGVFPTPAPLGGGLPRLLLFTDTLGDVNGVARFLCDMAADARTRGRPLMIMTSTRFACPDEPAVRNLPPRLRTPLPGYRTLDLALPPLSRMLALAREFAPDVVHVSTPGPVGLAGRRVARRLGVPLVGTWHTDFPAYVERLLGSRFLAHATRAYLRWFYRPFEALFMRSEAARRTMGDPPAYGRAVAVLPPGVCTRTFHPRPRDEALAERLGLSPGAVRVLYVGRVSVEKNLPLLVDIWRGCDVRLRREKIACELVVVGDGPYRRDMERALIGTRARFLGVRTGEELAAIYTLCDLFAFPSTTDTLGQVVLEAQASGLPVLVSERGGPASVVRNGDTGLVLRAEDGQAWAEAIVGLARAPNERRRLGAAAAKHARTFDIGTMFDVFWNAHLNAVSAMHSAAPPTPAP